MVDGLLGNGALGGDLISQVVLHLQPDGTARLHLQGEADGHLRMLPAILLPGLGKEPLGDLLLFPDAEHLRAGFSHVIAVGKALTVEGGGQFVELLLGGLTALPESVGIDPGDNGHILRTLHPALDLGAGHPHLLQLPEVMDQGHILQAQGIAVGVSSPAVHHPAGLGAHSPVAAPATDDGGEKALTGVAHTQGPVDEYLDLNGGAAADIGDLLPGQLPGQHHPLHSQGGAGQHPVQAVNGHLGGAVNGEVGGHLTGHPHHPQVLDNEGIYPDLAAQGDQPGGLEQLMVTEQGVQGEIHLYPPEMTIFYRRPEAVVVEIGRPSPGVEGLAPQIDGVRPALDGGDHRLIGVGGREYFHHFCFPLMYCFSQWSKRSLRRAKIPSRHARMGQLEALFLGAFFSRVISRRASASSWRSFRFSSRVSFI